MQVLVIHRRMRKKSWVISRDNAMKCLLNSCEHRYMITNCALSCNRCADLNPKKRCAMSGNVLLSKFFSVAKDQIILTNLQEVPALKNGELNGLFESIVSDPELSPMVTIHSRFQIFIQFKCRANFSLQRPLAYNIRRLYQ